MNDIIFLSLNKIYLEFCVQLSETLQKLKITPKLKLTPNLLRIPSITCLQSSSKDTCDNLMLSSQLIVSFKLCLYWMAYCHWITSKELHILSWGHLVWLSSIKAHKFLEPWLEILLLHYTLQLHSAMTPSFLPGTYNILK